MFHVSKLTPFEQHTYVNVLIFKCIHVNYVDKKTHICSLLNRYLFHR